MMSSYICHCMPDTVFRNVCQIIDNAHNCPRVLEFRTRNYILWFKKLRPRGREGTQVSQLASAKPGLSLNSTIPRSGPFPPSWRAERKCRSESSSSRSQHTWPVGLLSLSEILGAFQTVCQFILFELQE